MLVCNKCKEEITDDLVVWQCYESRGFINMEHFYFCEGSDLEPITAVVECPHCNATIYTADYYLKDHDLEKIKELLTG